MRRASLSTVIVAFCGLGLFALAGCDCHSCGGGVAGATTAAQSTGTPDCCGEGGDACCPGKGEGACCQEKEGAVCCKEGVCAKESSAAGTVEAAPLVEEKGDDVPAVLSFKMTSLDGKPVDLARYKGKVVVFVNVASKCGYTPQYKPLQELHKKYAQGLAVVGVPANEFGSQEPGSDADIAQFCKQNYGVEFDMLSKSVVKGPGQSDLYKHLTSKETNPKFAGEIKWNFEKFVIGRNGEIVGRFPSKVRPDSEEFIKVIEAELAKK